MSLERRRLFPVEEAPAESGHYGCPMLTRARLVASARLPRPDMRCSLGWALHDETEADRCRATDAVTDCWKVHPERAAILVLPALDDDAPPDAAPEPGPKPGPGPEPE